MNASSALKDVTSSHVRHVFSDFHENSRRRALLLPPPCNSDYSSKFPSRLPVPISALASSSTPSLSSEAPFLGAGANSQRGDSSIRITGFRISMSSPLHNSSGVPTRDDVTDESVLKSPSPPPPPPSGSDPEGDTMTESHQHTLLSSRLPTVRYETTAEGDVVVVEPSFDAEENDRGRKPSRQRPTAAEGRRELETENSNCSVLKSRSTMTTAEGNDSPHQSVEAGKHQRSHRRNLSDHFYAATTLSDDGNANDSQRQPR